MTRIEECILYRNFQEDQVLKDFTEMIEAVQNETIERDLVFYRNMFYDALNRLVEMANRYGFSGNLWCNYLTYLLVNKENAFSTSCEIVGRVEGSINQMAKHDFIRFKELFDFDIRVFDRIFDSGDGTIISEYRNTDSPNKLFNQRVRDRIGELSVKLQQAETADEVMEDMVQF